GWNNVLLRFPHVDLDAGRLGLGLRLLFLLVPERVGKFEDVIILLRLRFGFRLAFRLGGGLLGRRRRLFGILIIVGNDLTYGGEDFLDGRFLIRRVFGHSFFRALAEAV